MYTLRYRTKANEVGFHVLQKPAFVAQTALDGMWENVTLAVAVADPHQVQSHMWEADKSGRVALAINARQYHRLGPYAGMAAVAEITRSSFKSATALDAMAFYLLLVEAASLPALQDPDTWGVFPTQIRKELLFRQGLRQSRF